MSYIVGKKVISMRGKENRAVREEWACRVDRREKVTFEQRLKGGEGVPHEDRRDKSSPGQINRRIS